jgi:two-component system chemotaxis sensor kinase CheA
MSPVSLNQLPPNPLLDQFLSESRDLLEGASKKLMQLEDSPNDQGILNELIRCVHTLKGNSGLFTFPEMTRVLHASEDLLGMVRSGQAIYSRELADHLLDVMDYVGLLCGEIETTQKIDGSRAPESQQMAEALRKLMPSLSSNQDKSIGSDAASSMETDAKTSLTDDPSTGLRDFAAIPEAVRRTAHDRLPD